MEIKIESQKDNKLLDRKELVVILSFIGVTPKKDEIKNAICSKAGLMMDTTVLRVIIPRFGMKQIKVLVHSYKDVESLKKTEPRHILVRYGLAEKKAKKEKKKKKSAVAKSA